MDGMSASNDPTAWKPASLRNKLFIGGRWVDGVEGGTIDVINPHDGSVITAIAEATAADVDRAVEAAQKAFPAWSSMAAMDRGRLLLKLADRIEEEQAELGRLEALNTGHPFRDTQILDVPRTAVTYRYFGGMADKFEGSVIPVEAGFLNYLEREPVGVVGQIVPWNFPLMFTSWKMAPALAAGNCIVIKPSEITPLSTLRIAEMMQEVGIPDGVVNVVPGYGHTAGARIAEHPLIAKVAFTGSTATGRTVVKASAGNLKKLQLELGGKGANIVFEDAFIPAAVGGSAFAIWHNQGQACIAGSRLMLHESIADTFMEKFLGLTESIRAGQPAGPGNRDGAADLQDAPAARAGLLRRRPGGGRRDRDRRGAAGGSGAGRRLLRPADHRPREAVGPGLPGRGLRPVRLRHDVQGTTPRRWRSPTAPNTGWAAGFGPPTSSGRTNSPGRCTPAWSGSTATSGLIPARPSAGSASPATAARWASRQCANTRIRNRSG